MSIIYLNILLIFLNIYSSVDCLNSIEINEVINNKTSLRYDVYEIWKNRTSILKVHHDHSKTLDCFGFGETVAGLLNWYFTKKPNSASNIDVQFYLTSTRKRSRCLVLCGDQFGLEWTDFKPERKTIIIVHGFLSSHNEEWITEMENAFLNWEDVNVVTVDWSAHGNTWNYYRASVNGKIVAGEIVKFLSHVVNATVAGRSKEPNWGPIHMVGHSLGAHICGRAASEFKKLNTKWEVERITGLDPAQPCFVNAAYSLDQSDAKFVDIIHTNGKLWSHFGLGLPDPIGHVDFYPNGGRSQPGCLRIKNSWVTSAIGIGTDAIEQAVCSHGRSYIYLTESIKAATLNKKNCTFLGYTWDRSYRQAVKIINERMNVDKNNCNEMGIRADLYTNRGTFFVMTSSVDPYCDVSTSNIKEYAKQLGADFTDESED